MTQVLFLSKYKCTDIPQKHIKCRNDASVFPLTNVLISEKVTPAEKKIVSQKYIVRTWKKFRVTNCRWEKNYVTKIRPLKKFASQMAYDEFYFFLFVFILIWAFVIQKEVKLLSSAICDAKFFKCLIFVPPFFSQLHLWRDFFFSSSYIFQTQFFSQQRHWRHFLGYQFFWKLNIGLASLLHFVFLWDISSFGSEHRTCVTLTLSVFLWDISSFGSWT